MKAKLLIEARSPNMVARPINFMSQLRANIAPRPEQTRRGDIHQAYMTPKGTIAVTDDAQVLSAAINIVNQLIG